MNVGLSCEYAEFDGAINALTMSYGTRRARDPATGKRPVG